ncbi:hypothetical protein [Pullulanibacillus camelliae]|nr:hypothetical protein [Pullulanibacillus camelliae]
MSLMVVFRDTSIHSYLKTDIVDGVLLLLYTIFRLLYLLEKYGSQIING